MARTQAAPNGVATQLVQIPRREVWIDLPEEYAGLRVKVWVNFPRALLLELQSSDNDRLAAALGKIVLEHNDWADSDGVALPEPANAAFWQLIPDELAGVILVLLNQELGRLPNSLRAMRPT